MSTALVISPHLDDAVFSVGQLLAGNPGAFVATMYAGVPPPNTVDSYDEACGFANSELAMRHRRKEDETALQMLGARPVHLDLYGIQYGPHDDDQIAGALEKVIAELSPDRVIGPIGLVHPDHRRVGVVWRSVLTRYPEKEILAYEDLPYRLTFPRRSSRAISEFVRDYDATEARLAKGDMGAKACAMLAYSSQLRAASPLNCLEPEGLWLMAPSFRNVKDA